ncbi:hypothetical protein N1027_10640 [Herbiconiux sp. CPCC 205763]|uniref:SinR family protein n=1 Tax=Herbiconiux aconitum TaxID=2970913 RepID=A0ABT2GTG5_9MICO|nr:hypothetical protein [Herbiconiux aconitum]MCS5718590.1 hypothetical protein [Herbiconiux aconitum]
MTAVLLTYDLKTPGQKYEKLYEKLKSMGAWAHVMDSTWIITGASITSQTVFDAAREIVDDNDLVLATDFDLRGMKGWLREQTWTWVRDVA